MDDPASTARSYPPVPGEAAANWALFLDVDGTLVEIAADPDAVVVTPRVVAILGRLSQRLNGALALVSGRTVATLDALFAPLRLPAAGNHGLERRTAGGTIVGPPPRTAEMERVRRAFAEFAARHPGTVVEDKALSIALHFRRAPEHEREALSLAEALARSLEPEFRVQHGKMMVEIRPSGGDKGAVIDAFMAEPPFAGRIPVFAGDDVTDEDGFVAVNRRNGISLRVGDAQSTAARCRVLDVAALLDWLERVADGLDNGRGGKEHPPGPVG